MLPVFFPETRAMPRLSPALLGLLLVTALACGGLSPREAHGEAARHGTLGYWGSGNWGGSSFTVGRSTIYANGLVANQVGNMSYFNNGLVGRRMGNVTVYNNGLVGVSRGNATYFNNYSVGVPIRGGMVYGGGSPFPLGPTPFVGPAPAAGR